MKIHFIGIGGIGISGLAKFLQHQGHTITGSDIKETLITKKLQEDGIKVDVPHNCQNISDQDLVIHSAIIKQDNPEIVCAKQKNIKVLSRKEALLEILKNKKVYSVAGAHGKSTTSAILSSILECSAIIGAESKEFGSNVKYTNKNNIVVFEADESDGSFINSNPFCSIVTNAEPEHMEYYNYNEELFYEHYKTFIEKAEIKVLNKQDPFLSTLQTDAIWLDPQKDITNISYTLIDDEPHTKFCLKDFGEFCVWGFGEHIALDASLAILSATYSTKIETIKKNILNFKGIKKRFDIVSKDTNCVVIDDYGHHPTEIKATLSSVKEYAKLKGLKNITAIWQPHKFSRTLDNMSAFIECFEGVDELVILPVWRAGEEAQKIDFEQKFQRYNPTFADKVTNKNNCVELIKDEQTFKQINSGVVVSFGAGDITYQIRGVL